MRVVLGVAAVGLMLAAASISAQTPAAPSAQAPAPAAQPPRPFPEGAKVAFIDLQRIANESAEGKASTAKVKALNDKKVTELQEKQKSLQAKAQKLQQGENVMNPSAMAQLRKEAEREQFELNQMREEAEAEVTNLQRQLMGQFQQRLAPVVNQVAADKGLHMIFLRSDDAPFIYWADEGLDLTTEVLKRFEATGGTAGAATPAAKPPAAPPQKPPEPKPPVD
jgi:outer membrane protein